MTQEDGPRRRGSIVGRPGRVSPATGPGRSGGRYTQPSSGDYGKWQSYRSKAIAGTRILLARHAETAAPDRFHGAESDIGLSAAGARQAEMLGGFLEGERGESRL